MTEIAAQTPDGSRSLPAVLLGAVSALVPYALAALVLRLLIARAFFLSGQSKIDGLTLRIKLEMYGIDFSVILPTHIKPATLQAFAAKYAALPVPTQVMAYVFTYAEFLLPVCLVLGFATRFSALLLLVMSVLMAVYATPETFWTVQAYWIAILLVLISAGPGAISLDALIRQISTRDDAPAFH